MMSDGEQGAEQGDDTAAERRLSDDEVKAKLEVLEELAPARASGDELTPGGSELTPAAVPSNPPPARSVLVRDC